MKTPNTHTLFLKQCSFDCEMEEAQHPGDEKPSDQVNKRV